MIALQETKCRRSDVRQMNDGTLIIRGEKVPSRNVDGVGFVVHPTGVHLVDSHEILSPRFAIRRLCPLFQKPSISSTATHQHQQLMNLNWTRFMRSWRKKSFHKIIVGDSNAKLGNTTEEEYKIGRFGLGDRN
ncbi:hypothetical protein RB195_014161 [Necator americanus]|uniref:Endonuclease/exonuclease/phosphatase domain-containing protein n=1 Tax=Necator americanus TaxID=51031 RepID=A0ABR1DYZ5_NECAM